jgi:glutathione peroxidase
MTLYEIPVQTIDGQMVTLEPYRGRRLLIVNVASRCGFTPQYTALEELYRRRKDDLVVLGFPCNQFGRQEPGSNEQIQKFCEEQYDVSFPLFAKIDVNGSNAHPLYRHLKAAKRGLLGRQAIAWNFTKFLVGRNGDVLKRYSSRVKPEAIERELYGSPPHHPRP